MRAQGGRCTMPYAVSATHHVRFHSNPQKANQYTVGIASESKHHDTKKIF